MNSETIAAIATAMSDSGIGIIRISGTDSLEIVNKVFCTKSGKHNLLQYETHTVHYGFIFDESEMIDEVMVSIMKAPKSYTMEDTVEINCHGGVLMVTKILEIVLKSGARLAEPGEFTKRAFLNGRIDLAKAEAVMDLIHSKNELALKNSVSQLKGSVSLVVKNLRDRILYEVAFIESALDDPEHISTEGYTDKLSKVIEEVKNELDKLFHSADNGRLLKEGINTVILGKPNAGKSSLLNLLAGEERAIVTSVAGTTRDALEESIKIHGISLNMIDTAGIRNTDDIVEKIGVEKAVKFAKDAELILYVVDTSVPLDQNDDAIIELIKNKNTILLLNKSDLQSNVDEKELLIKMQREDRNALFEIIRTSTKDNYGIEILEDKIKDMFFSGKISFDDEVMITNMRHKQALKDAIDSIEQVEKSLEMDMPEDFYSIDLMSAYTSLGYIIGEEVDDDLVNKIFSKFCMGK